MKLDQATIASVIEEAYARLSQAPLLPDPVINAIANGSIMLPTLAEEEIGEVGEAKPTRAYSFPEFVTKITGQAFAPHQLLFMEDMQVRLDESMPVGTVRMANLTSDLTMRPPERALSNFPYKRDALRPLPNPCGECPWRNDHDHQSSLGSVIFKVKETLAGSSPCHMNAEFQCEGAKRFMKGDDPLIIPTKEEFIERRAMQEREDLWVSREGVLEPFA
jgi:hypothetical protein